MIFVSFFKILQACPVGLGKNLTYFFSFKVEHQKNKLNTHRHTLFYCTLLYHSQILHFLQAEGLWQLCVKQVFWHYFSPNSVIFKLMLFLNV